MDKKIIQPVKKKSSAEEVNSGSKTSAGLLQVDFTAAGCNEWLLEMLKVLC